ncbi:hypothetical protein SLA2020_483830 [Shorea laevis]
MSFLKLSLKLSWMGQHDSWAWNYTRHGFYSVKSGYHMAIEMQRNPGLPASSSSGFQGRRLWSLDIPEKVRLLLWSAYCNILPTKDNLHRRRIMVDPECPVCGLEQESVLHSLMTCPAAKAVWLGCPFTLKVSELGIETFAAAFDIVVDVLGTEHLELFCVVCWKLWNCRNNALWNGKITSPQVTVEQSLLFLNEYRRLIVSKGRGAAVVQRRTETRWKPPGEGLIKINVDGAISDEERVHGMGAVARDSLGEVMAAMACKGHGLVPAEIAEACSLRHALRWAQNLSFRRIIMESDCASIVTALNSSTLSFHSSLGAVLLDCKRLMASFLSCHVQHVRREGNAVAHELAKRALHAEADEFWIEEVPASLAHIVIGEKPIA